MENEESCIKGNFDVNISFVQSVIGTALESTNQITNAKNAKKRKEPLDLEEKEQSLGSVYIPSSQLQRCSKYFDTYFSKRWTTTTTTMPLHVTLDVHTNVEYYKECFSRMSSRKYSCIPSVDHCLNLMQVASQISYLTLVEDCVHYLASVPWSYEDERKIRVFADSQFYPSDCVADLSARLQLSLSNEVRYDLLFGMAERALCRYLDVIMRYLDVSPQPNLDLLIYRKLFANNFRIIISWPYQTLVDNVLKHIIEYAKKSILEAKEQPEICRDQSCLNVLWILQLLLETLSAKELVEYIVEESLLSDMLKEMHWIDGWAKTIHSMFIEVVEGRLLLKTLTRYMLLQKFRFLLEEINIREDRNRIVSNFVMTFPYKMQEEIFAFWLSINNAHIREEIMFLEVHEEWVANLMEKIHVHKS